MENQETRDGRDEKACCSKGRCCGGKALAAVALLSIGALGGYFGAKHCAGKDAQFPAPVSAPVK